MSGSSGCRFCSEMPPWSAWLCFRLAQWISIFAKKRTMGQLTCAERMRLLFPIAYVDVEVECFNEAVAVRIYENVLEKEKFEIKYDLNRNHTALSVDGAIVRYRDETLHSISIGGKYSSRPVEEIYNKSLRECLGLSIGDELPYEDYPMRSVRLHICFCDDDCAEYVYGALMHDADESGSCDYFGKKYRKITRNDERMISFVCHAWEEVGCFGIFLLKYENAYRRQFQNTCDRPAESAGLKGSIQSVIWSTGLIIILLNLLKHCT